MIIRAGAERSLWKRSVRVLFSQTIFGEECVFSAVQDTDKKGVLL